MHSAKPLVETSISANVFLECFMSPTSLITEFTVDLVYGQTFSVSTSNSSASLESGKDSVLMESRLLGWSGWTYGQQGPNVSRDYDSSVTAAHCGSKFFTLNPC